MHASSKPGSTSQPSDSLLPSPKAEVSTTAEVSAKAEVSPKAGVSTSSGTVDFVHRVASTGDEDPSSDRAINDGDQTVISQRPVAAPEEFYRTMPLSELAAMLEGRQLDHFAVDQMIGGGGMGAVFRGRDLRLDRIVAIKVIPAAKRDPETLRRFRLEAQAAAKLDHPNIARVYYVGEAEQWNYIVFEFIDGVNIRDLVEMEGPLSVDDAVYYTRQVAEALQHAHERDVVHRDVKPSNILVTANGAAKVVDMGLARNTALDKSTADATASGVTLGTFDYISPEQARNPRDADVRSDLYSLGCTLFFVLTGNPPFPEGTALQKLLSHGSQPPPDPRGWRDDLSDELYEITMKLMAKRPSDRYQKPSELISDLVMLAEVEDLPRSQSPGTLLFTPNIAQGSLLETNLPWLVALAFLLVSTLWLQSVQSLSNDYAISELEFKAREATAVELDTSSSGSATEVPNLPPRPAVLGPIPINAGLQNVSTQAPTDNPQSNVGRLPQIDAISTNDTSKPVVPTSYIGAIVVSPDLPVDVPPEAWENNLTDALRRVAQADLHEIQIRGRIRISRSLDIRGLDLRISGSPNSQAILEVDEELVRSAAEASAVFQIESAKLRLRGLVIEVNVADSAIARQGLFGLGSDTQLELDNCHVTVRDQPDANRFYVISYNDQPESGVSKRSRLANLTEPPAASDSILIRTTNSFIRGEGTYLRLNVTEDNLNKRIDMSLSNTLLALSGSVLEIKSPTGDVQSQRFVRMLCDQSTFVTQDAFAKLDYTGSLAPLLGLIRTSQSCVYWSNLDTPHVRIKGARRQSLLGNFNLLLLQGMNNSYDENIQDLCQAYLGPERIATFGFTEASTSGGWLGERGNESRVRWGNTGVPRLPLHSTQPADFAVADVLFSPGVSPANLPSANL